MKTLGSLPGQLRQYATGEGAPEKNSILKIHFKKYN